MPARPIAANAMMLVVVTGPVPRCSRPARTNIDIQVHKA